MTDRTETFLAFSETLADSSRALLLAAAEEAPRVDLKQDASFVTATDRAVEARLREQIRAAFPDHGIMGEDLAEEGAGPLGFRGCEEVGRLGDLDDLAVVHEDDAVGDRAGKTHFMCHTDHRHALPVSYTHLTLPTICSV